MTDQPRDPFDSPESRPAVSFKGAPVGTTVVCVIDGTSKLVQARDFETGKPAYWNDGNPKMTAVIDVLVDGEPRSVWAPVSSNIHKAIGAAQKNAGHTMTPGGTLTLRFVGEKPNDNPRLNPQKLYEARYTPPDAFATASATADDAPWV